MIKKIRYYGSKWRSFFLSKKKTNEILSGSRLFFITGMGRSGSTFLANLIDQITDISVHHETFTDYKALISAYYEPESAKKYFDGRRGKIIAIRIKQSKCKVYGEVNSLLRYHVNVIRNFHDAEILHLVRDGRLVVRSIMNRKAFTYEDQKHTGLIKPLPGDEYRGIWPEMDRFAKVCWYWSSTCSFLLKQRLRVIRLEDIINSYELFESQVAYPLQIHVPYELWLKEKDKPRNMNEKRSFPMWPNWSIDQKRIFINMCGDIMMNLGYEIS